ncbi:MAG: N-acetylmuramoyl-L-alanine amidase family protein [Eubacteriales bacterium]|nr:N-acetylmuramoyl-L-alanine amidase family protein [Eubacteriales bacterium]
MQNACKKFRIGRLLLLLMVFVAAVAIRVSASDVQAATKTGFQTINGKTYYIDKDGSKHKGWLELNGTKYYFDSKTGVQQKGWMTDSKGNKRYFTSKAGAMVTGWLENSKGQKRYFDKSTGIMKTKWMTLSGKKYYFYSKSGVAATGFLEDSKGNTRYFYSGSCAMATGWLTNTKGEKRYFDLEDGVMATGFNKIEGKTYYFYSVSGKMATGWVENESKGVSYYFDPETGEMYTGTHTIDGKEYTFSSEGVYIPALTPGIDIVQPTSGKTIKNYLAGALQPVGQALYVWGGGWNDSTRKGVSPTWQEWYSSQSSSYDYNNYRDLSTANRAKGLDCSGFVGWAAYQVMHSKSGVGSGYTVVSGEVGSYYKSLGWGTILTQANLAASDYTLKAGDVGYNSGHTWIVLGQCSDKSIVIIHSTPQAGCQISGTPTPSGDYSSEAITLAKKYMSKYPGYTKYDYHPSSGQYIRNGNYLRWNNDTLSDPEGYRNMTANQILYDLFGY